MDEKTEGELLAEDYMDRPDEKRLRRAQMLHQRIMLNGQQICTALLALCAELKEMRDRELYKELGDASFEEYVSTQVGIGVRQAYTYIGTFEKLPRDMLEQYAGIGITKLSLLAKISAPEREEFAEKNDLAGLSVSEMEKLVEEKNGLAEQISMMQLADERLKDETAQKLADLQAEVERLKAGPAPGEIEQIRHEAEMDRKEQEAANEAAMRFKADAEREAAERVRLEELLKKREQEINYGKTAMEKELAQARAAAAAEAEKKARAEAEQKAAEKLRRELEKAKAEAAEEAKKAAEVEIGEARAEAERLRGRLAAAGSRELAEFAVLMQQVQQVQQAAKRMREILAGQEGETAGKLEKALEALKGAI